MMAILKYIYIYICVCVCVCVCVRVCVCVCVCGFTLLTPNSKRKFFFEEIVFKATAHINIYIILFWDMSSFISHVGISTYQDEVIKAVNVPLLYKIYVILLSLLRQF